MMKSMRKFIWTGLVIIACSVASASGLELASPFGDNMFLQRGVEVPVWGKAKVGSKLVVSYNILWSK